MRAAIVTAAGKTPIYGDFEAPSAKAGLELITVRAAALSHFSKGRSLGGHYSSHGAFPSVAGAEGVGLTADGRRVFFILPEAPTGALAEQCLVRPGHCVALPEGLDDRVAAALANPGMSSWAALTLRAQLKRGETVLINGATGIAGRLAVQIARHLGAGRIIVAGRDASALAELGADAVVSFKLGAEHPEGAKELERALIAELGKGIHVVLDYLWGDSALAIIVAIAKGVEDGTAVRFVQVGTASGQDTLPLPGAALRSSAIQLMGSGVKSVPLPKLLDCIGQVFAAVGPAKLHVDSRIASLADIEAVWKADTGNPRVVITPSGR